MGTPCDRVEQGWQWPTGWQRKENVIYAYQAIDIGWDVTIEAKCAWEKSRCRYSEGFCAFF